MHRQTIAEAHGRTISDIETAEDDKQADKARHLQSVGHYDLRGDLTRTARLRAAQGDRVGQRILENDELVRLILDSEKNLAPAMTLEAFLAC